MLLMAAGSINASPIGPDANVSNVEAYEWDAVKGWYGATWTNGDATAYVQISEDGGSSVSDTLAPGTTSYQPNWTLAEVNSGDLKIRHFKNGVALSWVTISIAA
jgi:hypothetical protein